MKTPANQIKAIYHKPELTHFGKIADLTTGGSTGSTEYMYRAMMGCYRHGTGMMKLDTVPPPSPLC